MSGFADSINRSQKHIDSISNSLSNYFAKKQKDEDDQAFVDEYKKRQQGQTVKKEVFTQNLLPSQIKSKAPVNVSSLPAENVDDKFRMEDRGYAKEYARQTTPPTNSDKLGEVEYELRMDETPQPVRRPVGVNSTAPQFVEAVKPIESAIAQTSAPVEPKNNIDKFLDATQTLESGTNSPADIKPPVDPITGTRPSTASGKFQFIDSTAAKVGAVLYPELTGGKSAEELMKPENKSTLDKVIAQRDNPVEARKMAKWLAEDNAKVLKNLGVSNPSEAHLYLAHNIGPMGAALISDYLGTDPNTKIKDIPGFRKEWYENNKGVYGASGEKTVKQVMDETNKKFGVQDSPAAPTAQPGTAQTVAQPTVEEEQRIVPSAPATLQDAESMNVGKETVEAPGKPLSMSETLYAMVQNRPEFAQDERFKKALDIAKEFDTIEAGPKMDLNRAAQMAGSSDPAVAAEGNAFIKNYAAGSGMVAAAKQSAKPSAETMHSWIAKLYDPKSSVEDKNAAKSKIDEFKTFIGRDMTINKANEILANKSKHTPEEIEQAETFKELTFADFKVKKDYDYESRRQLIKDKVSMGGLDPVALDQQAQQYLKYGTMASLGTGGAAAKVAILNRAAELDPNRNIGGSKAYYDAMTGALKQTAKIYEGAKASATNAIRNTDLAINAIKKGGFPRTGSPLLTGGLNWWSKNINGNPKLTELETLIFTAAREYAKTITGSSLSIAELSTAAASKAEELMNASMNVDQFIAATEGMKADMDNNIKGWGESYNEQRSRFDSMDEPVKTSTSAGSKEAKQPEAAKKDVKQPKKVIKSEYSASANKTRKTYSDGTTEILDGKQ